jgi:hypothetical protein
VSETGQAEVAKGGVTGAGPGAAAAPVRCVKCEYDLAGLAEEGMCPECGRAVAISRKVWAAGLPAGRSLVMMRRGLVTAATGLGLLAFSHLVLSLVGLYWQESRELYRIIDFGPEVSKIPVAVGLWMCARANKRGARAGHFRLRMVLLWAAAANLAIDLLLIGFRPMWYEAVRNGSILGTTGAWLTPIGYGLGAVNAVVWPTLLVTAVWLMRRLGKTMPDREIALAASFLLVAAVVTEVMLSVEYLGYALFGLFWNLELVKLGLLPLYLCCSLLTLRVAQQLAAVGKTGEPREIRWIRDGWNSLRKLAWMMRIDEQEPPPTGR